MAKRSDNKPQTELNILAGVDIIKSHPLFGKLRYGYDFKDYPKGIECSASISAKGYIAFNRHKYHTPEEWAYIIAHLLLHLGLGHTNAEKISKGIDIRLWNIACDMYVTKFLSDIRFKGEPTEAGLLSEYKGSLKDELTIYRYLVENEGEAGKYAVLSTFNSDKGDISDLSEIWGYKKMGWSCVTAYESDFEEAVLSAVTSVLKNAGGASVDDYDTCSYEASKWFINKYPLLGGLATRFKVVEDGEICQKNEVSMASVDIGNGKIYVNPAVRLRGEELSFILAHEYLHAGLLHKQRAKGRDHLLWNLACDFIINGWLKEMKVGTMPEIGVPYDNSFAEMTAEQVYDELIRDIKNSSKMDTFRGYGKGDILDVDGRDSLIASDTSEVDDYYRNALMQGLEYHLSLGKGLLPNGLVEEIRALAMPPIPWEVELARWFDKTFDVMEKRRSYSRTSRRQYSTPDIPRPRYVSDEAEGRTFGVVIDTSGSMTDKDIGKALGAVVSYADAKDVLKVRVLFCDTRAYDMGYMSSDELLGRVEVTGRRGTMLQPAIDLLEASGTFPIDGPILIITDSKVESKLSISREHAFLIPKGRCLPFRPKGKVFYYE